MSADRFLFQAPENAPDQLGVLTGENLINFFRTLPWSFIHSSICSGADFDFLSLIKRDLTTLPD